MEGNCEQGGGGTIHMTPPAVKQDISATAQGGRTAGDRGGDWLRGAFTDTLDQLLGDIKNLEPPEQRFSSVIFSLETWHLLGTGRRFSSFLSVNSSTHGVLPCSVQLTAERLRHSHPSADVTSKALSLSR